MATITTTDGTQIFYKDWASGRPKPETDFTEDFNKFDIATVFIHGNDDQIVPIGVDGSQLVKGSLLKRYPGAGHSLAFTAADQFNADLLAFL